LNVGAGTTDEGALTDSLPARLQVHVSINAKGLLPMRRISKQSQVNPNARVRTVSFQAHAFSDGESIHLKLPGGLVSISSDEKQPSGHPYLHAALARLFE